MNAKYKKKLELDERARVHGFMAAAAQEFIGTMPDYLTMNDAKELVKMLRGLDYREELAKKKLKKFTEKHGIDCRPYSFCGELDVCNMLDAVFNSYENLLKAIDVITP